MATSVRACHPAVARAPVRQRRRPVARSVAASAGRLPVALPAGPARDMADFVYDLQARICAEASAADGSGAAFCTDAWERPPAADGTTGAGITRVLSGGALLEKAAANVSVLSGRLSAVRAKTMSARGRPGIDPAGGQPYQAVALSLVFHSASPMVPTFRSDVRYFAVDGGGFYGGGADLTPSYVNEEDFAAFHTFYRNVCNGHAPGGALYARLKKWTDDYFYLPARKEHRGIGGIFFDDLSDLQATAAGEGTEAGSTGAPAQPPAAPPSPAAEAAAAAFVRAVAEGFLPSYLPIAQRRRQTPFTPQQRHWQELRRGRYIEFNLLYDRGIKFGLEGGRMESLMVSAPPAVRWDYNAEPPAGSEEARMMEILRAPRAWVLG